MSYTAAVITVSDKGARGERKDTSGPAICEMLTEAGYGVIHTEIIPDEKEIIKAVLVKCADELGCALIITTGGTGFSPRDITPEATLEVIERLTPGIPEVMRAESMKITPNGCLSRETAGIRGQSLIINLPGSEKAVRENLAAVLKPVKHGIDMIHSAGSADCAQHQHNHGEEHHSHVHSCACGASFESGAEKTPVDHGTRREPFPLAHPSVDEWLKEAKMDPNASKVGMYLVHNGVVRESARAKVREGSEDTAPVTGMHFYYDEEKVEAAICNAKMMEGIYYIRVWLNKGELRVGDNIMCVLIGGDTRPHTLAAFEALVGEIKTNCVTEQEVY